MNHILKFLTNLCCLLIVGMNTTYAATVRHSSTMGDFAGNIIDPICIMTSAFYKICYLIGAALLIACAIQFKAHRNNPLQVRASQPIALLIFGLAFILLPIIAQLSIAEPSIGTSH